MAFKLTKPDSSSRIGSTIHTEVFSISSLQLKDFWFYSVFLVDSIDLNVDIRIIKSMGNSQQDPKNVLLGKQSLIVLDIQKGRTLNITHMSMFPHGYDGLRIWQSGIILARYAINQKDHFKDKFVLQLGSGTGIAGLSILKFTSCKNCLMSDYRSQVVENIRRNCKNNSMTRAIALKMDWKDHKSFHNKYDIVVGSDIIVPGADNSILYNTIKHFLVYNGVALIVTPEREGYANSLLKQVQPTEFDIQYKQLTGSNYYDSPLPNKVEGYEAFPALRSEKFGLYALIRKGKPPVNTSEGQKIENGEQPNLQNYRRSTLPAIPKQPIVIKQATKDVIHVKPVPTDQPKPQRQTPSVEHNPTTVTVTETKKEDNKQVEQKNMKPAEQETKPKDVIKQVIQPIQQPQKQPPVKEQTVQQPKPTQQPKIHEQPKQLEVQQQQQHDQKQQLQQKKDAQPVKQSPKPEEVIEVPTAKPQVQVKQSITQDKTAVAQIKNQEQPPTQKPTVEQERIAQEVPNQKQTNQQQPIEAKIQVSQPDSQPISQHPQQKAAQAPTDAAEQTNQTNQPTKNTKDNQVSQEQTKQLKQAEQTDVQKEDEAAKTEQQPGDKPKEQEEQ